MNFLNENLLSEEVDDIIDELNDLLTTYCEKTTNNYSDIISYVEKAEEALRLKGLSIDYDDIERIRVDLEDPEDKEAISFNIPLYSGEDQTELNLVVTYYQDAEDSEYEVEMEIQYSWESDLEDEEFEFELPDGDFGDD